MAGFCKSRVTQRLRDSVEAIKDDDAAIKAFGAKECAATCRRILESGTCGRGLHFYSLNVEETTFAVLEELGLKKAVAST